MNILRVDQAPGLWPESDNRDNNVVHATRLVREVDGMQWTERRYNPFSAYGPDDDLAPGQPRSASTINILAWVPHRRVIDRILTDLAELSRDCPVVWWNSGIQCFLPIAKELKRLFRLALLNFGDDSPGSSEVKTFPIARHFDVLLHAMYLWDFTTGKSVPQVYQSRGLRDCRFYAWGPMEGVYDENWFARKRGRILAGDLPHELVWLGVPGYTAHRRHTLTQLSREVRPQQFFYGVGGRDGYKQGAASAIYEQTLFGLNVPEGSIFNGRFADLCCSGTIQIVHDPWKELPRFGFLPDTHFLAYDGTSDGLQGVISAHRDNREGLAAMARAARTRFLEFRTEYDGDRVLAKTLCDYAGQIEKER